MKKVLILVLAILVLSLVISCARIEDKHDGEMTESTDTAETETQEKTDEPRFYPVRYIKSGAYREDIKFPYTLNIESFAELESYFFGSGSSYHGLSVSAFSQYKDDFFNENMLVIAVLQEGSGSITHEFMGVTNDDTIWIKRIVPEACTMDIAMWHIIVEMPRECAEGHEFKTLYYGEDNREIASFGHNFVYMSAKVPMEWEYNIKPYTEGSDTMGIEFYPSSSPQSKVLLYFLDRSFALECATGLVCDATGAGEYTANRYRYDPTYSESTWELYVFEDLPGLYTLEIVGFDENIEEYQDDIEGILNTLELSDPEHIGKSKAIEIAKENCTIEYEMVSAEFDYQKGLWVVNFSQGPTTVGGDQTVFLCMNGKYHSSEYGE